MPLELSSTIPVHWLSKEARRRVIEIMLSTRSIHQLAQELGISPTAVRKYLEGRTHPSDQTMIKAFEILAPYEKEQVYRVVIDDLTDALNFLLRNLDEESQVGYLEKRIREVLEKIGHR